MKKMIISIEGMACEMCEATVKDVLRKHFNPEKLTASHGKGEATMVVKEEVDPEAIRAALDPTGYIVTDVRTEDYVKKGFLSGLFGR